MLGLELRQVHWQTSDGNCATLKDHDGDLELCHQVSLLLRQHWVPVEQVVLQTLADAQLSHYLVLEGVQTEAQSGEPVLHLGEEGSSGVGLEGVVALESSLVHGTPVVALRSYRLYLLGLSLARGHDDVQCVDLVDVELVVLHLLVEGLLVDDGVVAVDQVLLELVGQHSLQRIHLVGLCHLGDGLRDVLVEVARLELSQSSLHRLVGSENDIGLPADDGRCLVGLDDDCVGDESDVAVDVDSEVDLDEVSLFDNDGVLLEGRVVTAYLVDGEAGGEGDSLVHGLFVVDLSTLRLDQHVGHLAGVNNLHSHAQVVQNGGQHD